MGEKISIERDMLTVRPGFTIFDAFHLLLPLGAASGVVLLMARRFGWAWACPLAAFAAALIFWVLRFAIPAFVLFLYRRYSPEGRIGHEAACYVLTHFKTAETKVGRKDENA